MNILVAFGLFSILFLGCLTINSVSAQIDPSTDIVFLQTGEFQTTNNHFLISSNFEIREFFNGNIIRISGQTLEGFPYITYSIIKNDEIDTVGKIFINGEFVKLFFNEKELPIIDSKEKKDDLSIVVQYTQRAHSKQNIFVDVRIFEDEQNKFNDFSQNYAYISDTNIEIIITNNDNQEVFSSKGITNDKGLFETKYTIPDNSKRETLTITINAENENSSSSKILQVFTLGNIPSDGGP